MAEPHDTVFLFDVDNTLLDNEQIQVDLDAYLTEHFGEPVRAEYRRIFEDHRDKLGYADYLGALERYRDEHLHDPAVSRMANWLVDYPFADRLYPGALEAVAHAARLGRPVILSDGDAVFQPRKVYRSGLWNHFNDHVLIYIHKELELAEVERLYPARHYVMVDDKPRIIDAVKRTWGHRVTTVFVRQGRYAFDPETPASYLPGDKTIERIGDFPSVMP
jgi:FMN phosphatase YigB (HAD superfamily)